MLAACAVGLAAPASAADVLVGIGAKPKVTSWGVTYRFVHSGQVLTMVGAIRPARATNLTLQYSTDGRTWISQLGRNTDAAGNTTADLRPTSTRSYRWVWYGDGVHSPVVSSGLRPTVFPALRSYPNCTELNRYYAHGVGRPNADDSTTGTKVRTFLPSSAAYALNDGGAGQSDLDRDNDGIACEKA